MTKVNLGLDTSGRPLILDDTTLAKVRWAEAQLGIQLTLIQGSYRAGIGSLLRSGGTHDRGGAVDFRSRDIPASVGVTKVLRVLRESGLIAWFRWQSAFPDHEIHALDYGNPRLSRAAKKQVVAWQNGRNGLLDNGPDDGPRVTIPKEVPAMTGARIDGIDLSHYQGGALDFAKAKSAGVLFLYHKATEGTSYTDPLYARRRTEAAVAGIAFGAYHFARPSTLATKTDAVKQARYFVLKANPKPGDMPPALDLEQRGGAVTTARLTAWVGAWVTEVERLTGLQPAIYTNFNLSDNFNAARWAARYSDSMLPPNPATPWSTWTIWQFSDGKYGHPNTVPGIGACDINTLNTSNPQALVAALTAKPQPAKPPKKPTTPTPPTEPDMPLSDADIAKIAKAVAHLPVTNRNPDGTTSNATLTGMVSRIEQDVNALDAKVQAILDAGKAPGA